MRSVTQVKWAELRSLRYMCYFALRYVDYVTYVTFCTVTPFTFHCVTQLALRGSHRAALRRSRRLPAVTLRCLRYAPGVARRYAACVTSHYAASVPAAGAGQDGGGAHLGAEPGCHRVRGGPGREGERAAAVGALPPGRARGQHAHAQGPGHRAAPRLWVRGVPQRGRRGLRHQDHEHDQAVREADPRQQSLGPQQEPGRGGQHLHRQPGPRDRREAALRHLQRLRGHPADAQNHAGPRHGQLQGLRLHQLRQLRRLRRRHRGHERAVPLQPPHHRLLRLQEGFQGRAARLGGRAPAGSPKPPLAGGSAPPALRRRPPSALGPHPRGHLAGPRGHPSGPPPPRIVPPAGASPRSAAPRHAPCHAAPPDATRSWSPRPPLGGCAQRWAPPSPSPLPPRRDASPRNAPHAGAPRPPWHGPAPPRTPGLRRAAPAATPAWHAAPRPPSHGDAAPRTSFRVAHGSPRPHAAPRDARPPSADASPRLQRPPSPPTLRLPEGPPAPPARPEAPRGAPTGSLEGPPALKTEAPCWDLLPPRPQPSVPPWTEVFVPERRRWVHPRHSSPLFFLFPPSFPPFFFIVFVLVVFFPPSLLLTPPGRFFTGFLTGFCFLCEAHLPINPFDEQGALPASPAACPFLPRPDALRPGEVLNWG